MKFKIRNGYIAGDQAVALLIAVNLGKVAFEKDHDKLVGHTDDPEVKEMLKKMDNIVITEE